jgi:hypothetical protein
MVILQNTRSNAAYSWAGHYNINRPYASNGLNQHTQSGGIVPSYDAKGNLTSAGTGPYGYTAENRLASSPAGNYRVPASEPMLKRICTGSPSPAECRFTRSRRIPERAFNFQSPIAKAF